jgi:hypothetical protein
VIPTPLTADDRAASYWWELSMRQVEVSRTLVLDDPPRGRGFFEALVADNIGIGHPDEVAAVFRAAGAEEQAGDLPQPRHRRRQRDQARVSLQAQSGQAAPTEGRHFLP